MTLKPTFLLALRGIWLFTWTNEFNWRRLPIRMISLLVLPFLVYITTKSPEAWSNSNTLLGDPVQQLNNFSSRLMRSKIPLQPEQRSQMRQIFEEEFARAETDWHAIEPASNYRRSGQIRACNDRMQERAQSILDAGQFTQFQTFLKRNLALSENQSNGPVWTRTSPFYHWLIDFYFFIMLPLSCVQVCGGLIRNELQAATLGFLTTRPLSRARLVIIKYLSQTAWLQILLLVETLLLFEAGNLRQIPALGALLPLFLAAQFLAVFAWSALGIFLGQISNRYIALALVYGAIVELGIGRIPTNINTLSLMRHLKTLLAHNPALQNIYEWTGTGVPFSIGALVMAAAIFLSLAALLFTFLEYHHTSEMQK
jgi:ABC-type transport system involved in multi-copper enzyme maturation permease subunit